MGKPFCKIDSIGWGGDGVGHTEVGWGGSFRGRVGWCVGWGGSCRGGVGHVGLGWGHVGVGHVGVGVGHVGVWWGGVCHALVGWVM